MAWRRGALAAGGGDARRQAADVLHDDGADRAGRRGDLPQPGLPDLRVDDQLRWRQGGPLPLREEREFRFDPDEFRALVTERTRLIVLNSPQNPTGGVLT